ncbi:tyrosine-protein kinase baz1b-like [Plakobranchus ocellatus]|uniref:Tyrosine-protein kinase BAZ1B n=1 Tax=Plakobranchus ocellatus TaxID=259542 RepID=A0AAV3ZQL0_9GAST|nr:tyrosine-protein kinase baz1b-like [Plakobranchus ocellatus]
MCDSPSSDKENSSEEKGKDKSPKKWVPPKFLPYTYSIELEDEAKVVHSVPASDLQRAERSPSKDLLRLFVRVSAIRSGTAATSPWVVNSDLVSQYRLVSKFADFFFSPIKVADAMKKAEENGKKRKLSNGTPGTAAKKLKLDKSTNKEKKSKSAQKKDKNQSSEKEKKKKDKSLKKTSNGTPKTSSPTKKSSSAKKKSSQDAVVVVSSDSEDDVSLAKLKPSTTPLDTDSDSDIPLYQLAEQTTPKKKKKKSTDNSSDEDVPLSKITPSTPKKKVSEGSIKKKTSPTKKKDAKSSDKKKNNKDMKKEKDGKKKEKKLSPKKKDGMKQVTLYDLTKKGKLQHAGVIHTTPQKSPAKAPKSPPKPPQTPAIVRRLLGMKQDTLRDKMLYNGLLKKAVSILSPVQIKALPEKLRAAVEHKKNLIEEKEKMAKMKPEELEAYIKEKKAKAKQAQKQRMLQKLRDQRKRFEDTDLQLTPLPTAKLVPTPDGFPNSLFGEVAMVTEFINCYSGLLMPDSEYPIYTDALMKALVGGASGFTYLSRVLNVLLQTLLQDQITKGCEELSTQLSDIAVSPYTASELVRLCVRRDEDEDDDDIVDNDVPEDYVKLLEDSEFFELGVEQKLSVLRGLCLRVLGTDAVQDYMIEQQGKAGQLTKQKVLEMKEMAAQKKSEKQNNAAASSENKEKEKDKSEKKVEADESKTPKEEKVTGDEKTNKDGSLSILSFYGKEAKDSGAEDNGDESKDWGSIVKSRRILAAKAAEEKERREKERAAQRREEMEEERQREKLKKKSDQIAEAINLARMVLRQEPIGTDRNHDRYWVFTNTTPGLYLEKGWMGEEVNYKVPKPEGAVGDLMSESEEEDNTVSQTGTTPLKVVYKTKRHVIETSAPHPGQNLWFTFRSQKDVDGLLKSLHPQGIRESLLKKEIKARYDDLLRAIIQAQRTNLALRDCDGEKEMVEGFKKDLSDMELRLRNGGLGGVSDFDKFEAKLTGCTDISVMGECLLEVKEGILEKFLQGFMTPVVKSELQEEQSDDEEEEEKKEEGEDENEKPKEKEHKREKAVREWKEAIESCQTMSRLHVLMAILDCCIKWEKSAENAKCKICRKKCDDAKLLLCDECNQAFHMYCLRPAISKLPTGDWFCPACKPRRPQVRPSDLESESEEEEKEEACRECGGRDKLIFCTKCPAAFHTQCHDPPLRHPPRGVWECTDCKSGVSGRRKGRFSRKAAPRRNYRQLAGRSEDEEEDEDEEEEEEEESEEETPRSRSSRSRSSRSNRRSEHSSTRSRDRQRHTSATNSGSRGNSGRASRSSRGGQDQDMTSTTPSRTSRRGPSELSLCEDILQKVMKNKSSWPFLEPVDKKLVPDYYALIKKPMDFQTMLKKCARLSYASPQEFIEDAALVFENAESYNKPDSEVYSCMLVVEKQLKDLLAKVLPDWTYYRTVLDKDKDGANSSSSESGRRRSRNK